MRESQYTAPVAAAPMPSAPALAPSSWANEVSQRGVRPPSAMEMRLDTSESIGAKFVNIPQQLVRTFEYARNNPGAFAISMATSMTTFMLVKAGLVTLLGGSALASGVALAMLTSAVISVGQQVLNPEMDTPKISDLSEAKNVGMGAMLSTAMTRALWTGLFSGTLGVILGGGLTSMGALEWKSSIDDYFADHMHNTSYQGTATAISYGTLESVANGGNLILPVAPENVAEVGSGYGKRWHPVLKYMKLHEGIDLPAAEGTPVLAVADGTVTFVGREGDASTAGNYLVIDHGDYKTRQLHFHTIEEDIKVGSKVVQGQELGGVGDTGRSRGNHLHFEILVNDKAIDPAPYLPLHLVQQVRGK